MVMNEATDIAFYSVDPQLRAHLYRRMEILENSAGQRVRERGGREGGRECIFFLLLQEEEEDLRGLLTIFFAPLTTSFVSSS